MKSISQQPDFSVSQKIYERLLLAYPLRHRADYGTAMAQLFRDQCRDAWRESRNWGLLKLWLRVLPDLASTSTLERLAALNERKTMNDKLANLSTFRAAPVATFFRTFIVVFLLVFIASVVITFLLPQSYASTARIKVEPDAPPVATFELFQSQTMLVIQSPIVLDPVIDKLNLNVVWGKKYFSGETLKTTQTRDILKQRLQLAPVRNTKLIAITVFSDDKKEAAQIANAVAESYHDYRMKNREETASARLVAMQQLYQVQENEIQKAQAELESLRQQLKIESDVAASQSPQEQPFWNKQRDLGYLLELHKNLFAKIEDQKLAVHFPASGVQVTDRAEPGRAPVRPNKTVNIVLGAFAGVFLASAAGAAFAFLSFFLGKRWRKTAAAV